MSSSQAASAPAATADPDLAPTQDPVVRAAPLIAVKELTPHPGNPREDLDLTADYIASLAEGVMVPLLVIPREAGGYWITDGARRYEGAIKAGLTEVPCVLDVKAAKDPAGKYLTMVTTARQRKQLKPLEAAAALFAAHQHGASASRMRKATGLPAEEVKAALTAARMPDQARTHAAAAGRDLTLLELAVFAEFGDDPDALQRLTRAVPYGRVEHTAELIRAERAEQAERERLGAELRATGVTVVTALPAGAAYLSNLRHDQDDLTPQSHADCPGHTAILGAYHREPEYCCTSPQTHGHTSRWKLARPASGSAPARDEPAGRDAQRKERQLVLRGNRAWVAAGTVRHRWIKTLLSRRTAPPQAARFIASQLLTMPDPLSSGLAQARHWSLFQDLAGQSPLQLTDACGTASPGKLPLLMLTPILVTYEQAMTEGDGSKATWRPDRHTTCPYHQAGQYLTFLASIGYQLSGIEQAVADGVPYTGTDDSEPGPGQLTPVPSGPDTGPARPGDQQDPDEPRSRQAA